jgi:hypothetical protein
MKLEDFFKAVVGSRDGEFKPDLDSDVSEEEITELYDESEKNKKEKGSFPSLENAEKKYSKKLGGGVNESYFVEFTNGEKGVFKPSVGEDVFGKAEPHTFYKRERAAYLVDLFFDLHLVPPTVVKEIDEKIGSVQMFIPDTEAYIDIEYNENKNKLREEKSFRDQMKTLWIFDLLIHNSDRHKYNLLCSETNKKISVHAIDNGCSFCEDDFFFGPNEFFDEDFSEDFIKKIKRFLEDDASQRILENLLNELLPEKEVSAFFSRVEKIGNMISESGRISSSDEWEIKKF